MRTHRSHAALVLAAVLATAASVPVAHAQSGRLSLAERVAKLEQQSQGPAAAQGNIQLLNRIEALQAELAELRGLVEQQTFEIEALKRSARDQYLDVDGRLSRLEGGGTGAAPSPGAPSGAPAATPSDTAGAPATAAPPSVGFSDPEPGTLGADELALEAPDVRPPVDGQVESAGLVAGALSELPAEGATQTADPAQERVAYESAFEALKDGRYAESARRFKGFLDQYPNGEYAPNAMYWLGESYYVTQNYAIAKDSFSGLLQRFPNSSKAPDALLKLGYCQFELREWAEAEQTLNSVIQRYPDTTVARLAQGRLRALMLENRR